MPSNDEKTNILIVVTGSIAAYKSVELLRSYQKKGYNVKVVMSEGATKFISPLTFESLIKAKVPHNMWDFETGKYEHLDYAKWADLIIVAPASADTISAIASARADQLHLAIILAASCPIVIAPAMNCSMYKNKILQDKIKYLKEKDFMFIEPDEGDLACGDKGIGRFAKISTIYLKSRKLLMNQDYEGLNVFVATGPTREYFDPVRFITNKSSGKLGLEVARAAYTRGANVTLVHGPLEHKVPSFINSKKIRTAKNLKDLITEELNANNFDIFVMAAAVADFAPASVSDVKLKTEDDISEIKVTKNPDIISWVTEEYKNSSLKNASIIGFVTELGEIDELVEQTKEKLRDKGLDMIVGSFSNEDYHFDSTRVWLITENRNDEISASFKSRIAHKILDSVKKIDR